jgi:hypothetical protein
VVDPWIHLGSFSFPPLRPLADGLASTQSHVNVEARQHVDQPVRAEEIDSPAQEIAHAWLPDAENPSARDAAPRVMHATFVICRWR